MSIGVGSNIYRKYLKCGIRRKDRENMAYEGKISELRKRPAQINFSMTLMKIKILLAAPSYYREAEEL